MPQPELVAWFEAHARPLWEAHYAQDLERARRVYDSALAALNTESNPDLQQAKRLRLGSYWMFVLAELGSQEEQTTAYMKLLADCAASTGEQSSKMAPLIEAMARMQADALGIADLLPLQLLKLLRDIPEETRGPNFWNLAAEWAFRHGDGQLLEDAYVFFTTQRPAEMADQMFARLRLMRGLRDGNAREQDVLETVHRMEVLSQMWDFERVLIDECEAQGLMTEEVRTELELKKLTLEAIGKHAPERS